jgi:hypothetical protein
LFWREAKDDRKKGEREKESKIPETGFNQAQKIKGDYGCAFFTEDVN